MPPLPSAPDLKAATARVLTANDGTAGTALLLTAGFVATCAHVVRAAAGLAEDQVPDGAIVRLLFPFAQHATQPFVARVTRSGWRPEVDVAILKIENNPPYQHGWSLGREVRNDEAINVDCFGFGASVGCDGGTAEARIPTNSITGPQATLRLRDVESALRVEHGFSGAPVYDLNMCVVGLLWGGGQAQGRQIAHLILATVVNEIFLTAWTAAGGDDRDAALRAALFHAARAGVAELRRGHNAPRLPDALETHIKGLEETIGRPETLAEACEELRGIEERWIEVKRLDLASCVPRFALGELVPMLAGLVERLRPASGETTQQVDNDWDVNENLPQGKEIPCLLEEIEKRLTFLVEPRPPLCESDRRRACAALRRLRGILYGDPLSLSAVDQVRGELERLDRDVFSLLILECQLLLGRYATRLPGLAVFRDRLPDESGPELVVIPTGEFLMGSPESEKGRYDDEGPQHEVTIGRRFALGRYPVTVGEYRKFVEAADHRHGGGIYVWTGSEWKQDMTKSWRDPGFSQTDRHPVVGVSWRDAVAYYEWLTKETGKAYRLPSEAEWEYACRAGTTTRYSFGDAITPKDANYGRNVGKTTEVGAYQKNPWGLCDMHGNVREWVADVWHANYFGAPVDVSAWMGEEGIISSRIRVIRGGAWGNNPRFLRSASRLRLNPDDRGDFLGCRVSRTLD